MIVLGFLTLFFALRSDIFLIHDIKVALDRKADWCVDEEKVKSTLTLKSRSILFANLNNEENNLKEKYLCIKDVAFKKDYPDRINLDLKIRTPFAKLVKLNVATISAGIEEATQSADLIEPQFGAVGGSIEIATSSSQIETNSQITQIIVDEEGFGFSQLEGLENVPNIYSLQNLPNLGETVESKPLVLAVKLTKELDRFELKPGKIIVLGIDSVEVNFENNFRVIFSPEKDVAFQASSLQLIMRQAKIDGDQIESVDLRFDKPVVRFISDK